MASPARKLATSVTYFVLSFLLATLAWAQQAPFVPITTPGAPKGCFFMFQDSRGGMWLAGCETGDEGLFYFDGSRFIAPLKSGFPHVIVRGMAEDSESGIWLSSSGGLFRLYQGQLEKEVDGVALAGITKVAPDVFLATVGTSTDDSVKTAKLLRITRAQAGWKAEAILNSLAQIQFRQDQDGRILYGCDEGFCELKREDVIRWRPGLPLNVVRHLARTFTSYSSGASVVFRDRAGCVWMRSGTDLSYLCPGDSRPFTLPADVASLGFPQIIELKDGSVVVPSYGKLAIGRPGKFQVLLPQNGYPVTRFVLHGDDDSLWLSSTAGLFVLGSHLRMEFWTERDGLNGSVWSILRSSGKVLALADVSTRVLDQERSRWRLLRGPSGRLFPGPDDTVMVATGSAVFQMSRDWKQMRKSSPAEVWLMAQTPHGTSWAAGNGVSQVVAKGTHLNLQSAGISSQQINVQDMQADGEDDLAVCSAGGFGVKDHAGWHVISQSDGLLQNECNSFAIDQNGDVWYAYQTIPAFSLIQNVKGGRPRIQHFQTQDRSGPVDYFLRFDRRGWLWRGASDGVYIADLEQAHRGEWFHLNGSDGLPALNANQQSFFADGDGSIWFGAENSVIHLFPPDDFLHPSYAPSVFVSAFSANGGPPEPADLLGQVKSGVDLMAHIGSLQFDRRNALRLRYRILPEHTSWSFTRQLDIPLGRLRWGKHTLEVQAQLGPGPWSGTATQSFNVLKPFWLTWPALAGIAVFSLAGGSLGRLWWRQRRRRLARALPELAEWRLAALVPEAYDLLETTLDQRFTVVSVLGRGGFATVFAGEDLQEKRRCAIKVFRGEVADDDWLAHRIQQEIAALEAVRHDNVVRIYGHGRTPAGAPYLVMEFIAGETLRDVLSRDGAVPPQRVARLLRQAGSALDALHARGIYHRDLKPENILLRSRENGDCDLVLIDFSIALVKEPDRTLHGISRAAGTVHYMAPEQVVGHAGPVSDIYSLAKIVIEMLTGKGVSQLLPEASLDLPAQARELFAGLGLGLPAAAIDLLCSALQFDPARRPANAGEFAEEVAGGVEEVVSR